MAYVLVLLLGLAAGFAAGFLLGCVMGAKVMDEHHRQEKSHE